MVAPVLVELRRRRLDPPAVLAVVALVPPAIQDGEVDHAIHARFHPRGSRCLQRMDGVVEPHIHAGHEPPRDVQVVALDEQQPSLELLLARHVHQRADQLLAGFVRRMRLAGEEKHHRPKPMVSTLGFAGSQ